MALKTLAKKVVSGANTATALSSTAIYCHKLTILSSSDNAAAIWVGDSAVSNGLIGTARGNLVAAAGVYTVDDELSPNGFDISKLYFISSSATASVYISYIEV